MAPPYSEGSLPRNLRDMLVTSKQNLRLANRTSDLVSAPSTSNSSGRTRLLQTGQLQPHLKPKRRAGYVYCICIRYACLYMYVCVCVCVCVCGIEYVHYVPYVLSLLLHIMHMFLQRRRYIDSVIHSFTHWLICSLTSSCLPSLIPFCH